MGRVALFFQPSQDSPHRFLPPPGQLFAHGFGRHRAPRPDELHNCVLQFAQILKRLVRHYLLH
jgi:hypothetical protein